MNTEIKIKDIMTVNLITVNEKTPTNHILKLFNTSTIHHLPVLDNADQLVGIISKEDLLKPFYQTIMNNEDPNTDSKDWYNSTKAKDIMTPNPIAIDPDDHVGLAADIFYANQFRALPVVEFGELLGIITPYDLLKYAYAEVQVGDNPKEELRPMTQ